MITHPSTCSVPPARSASASSMQSPPANAEATRGQELVSRIRPTWRISQVNIVVHQLAQSQMMGQGHRQEQPSIGHQAMIVEGHVDAIGALRW